MGAIYSACAFGEKLTENITYYNELLKNMGEVTAPDNINVKICEECAVCGADVLSKICEGYQFLIAFSGELENREALILKLSAYGYHFSEKNDAEAALFSYIHFGEDAKNLLFGDFSLIIYDSMRHQVFAYSSDDEFPLFYRSIGGKTLISSSCASLLLQDEEKLCLSPVTLSPYLVGAARFPHEIFDGVFLLTSGSALKIKNGKLGSSCAPKSMRLKKKRGSYQKIERFLPENFCEQDIYNSISKCVQVLGVPLLSECDFLMPLSFDGKNNASKLCLCPFNQDVMPFLEGNNFYYPAVLKTLIPTKCEDFSTLSPEEALSAYYAIDACVTDCGENLGTETIKKFLVPLRRILLGIIAKNDSPILAFFKRHTLLSFCEGAYSVDSGFEIALLAYFIKLNIWLLEYSPRLI